MAFDGGFLHKTVCELKEACGSHIDKIYQPSKDELVLLLRKKGFAKRLLITARSGSARIHFTENKYENPAVPPNFCMLMRKHLSSAKLISIEQPSLERVAVLCFSALNELGDTVELKLVCELIGNQANIILLKDGRIADALHRSDVETAKRLILPGAVYEYPESRHKLNPLSCNISAVCNDIISSNESIPSALLSRLDGFSPLVCREAEFLAERGEKSGLDAKAALENALESIMAALNGHSPMLLLKPDGTPLDFSYLEINQYGTGYTSKQYESFSALLDAFYTAKDNAARINTAAHDIIRLVSNIKSRTEKKLALRLAELKSCSDREKLRIYGELLKANLHIVPIGSSFAEVPNYYDPEMSLIRIPLNPALSPSKNAERYFKSYKKTYSAEQALTRLTQQDKDELTYLDSVLESISRAETLSDIAEIRQELSDSGYIKRSPIKKKADKAVTSFKEYRSAEDYRILVGKNNTQNDYITTKLASKGDMWFHVKGIPGSHVAVLSGGEPLSDETVLQAATLAAENSRAAASAQVPVDYTLIKHVKKPSGAKAGMVIYTTNKTVYVTPRKEQYL